MATEKDPNEDSEGKEDSSEQDRNEEQPEPQSNESKTIFRIIQALSRMEYNSTKRFYFCTVSVSRLLRLVQFILALLCLSVSVYFCTHSEEIENMISPYCLANTRELYFMLCCYHSLLGCLAIILAGTVSFIYAALQSSFYPILFDTFQFFSFFISVILMLFARASSIRRTSHGISNVMPEESSTKIDIFLPLGFMLGCLHLASAYYDLSFLYTSLVALRRILGLSSRNNHKF